MDMDESLPNFSVLLLEIQGANLATRTIMLDIGVPGVAVELSSNLVFLSLIHI